MKIIRALFIIFFSAHAGAQQAVVWELRHPGIPTTPYEAVELVAEGEGMVQALKMSLSAPIMKLYFYRETLGFFPETLRVMKGSPLILTRLEDRNFSPDDPLPLDLGSLSVYDSVHWRKKEWEFYRWNLKDSILMMEALDYKILDLYLKRMAFYVEKTGFRGQLLTDSELNGKFGWRGYDFGAPDMARFYSKAFAQDFPLNPQELELLRILVKQGVLAQEGSQVVALGGALIGYLRETPWSYKQILLPHEAAHGIFFLNETYRAQVTQVWQQLPQAQKELWYRYLWKNTSTETPEHTRRGEGPVPYDITYEELIINEFQAYWLQQKSEKWPDFIKAMVELAARGEPGWERQVLGGRSRTVELQTQAGAAVEKAYLAASGMSAGLVNSLEILR